jgi:hypothetical protein
VKRLSTRPAWVIDNFTFDLFNIGMENADLPEDLRLDAAMEEHLLRLREWAEKEVGRRAGRSGNEFQSPTPAAGAAGSSAQLAAQPIQVEALAGAAAGAPLVMAQCYM